jgi:hypothetical protein
LHTFSDNPQPGAFLAGLLIVPGIELEAAFNKDWPALLKILVGDFCQAGPQHHVHVGNLFATFPFLSIQHAINGKANIGNSRAFGCVPDFRVSGKISNEKDAVQICHKPAIFLYDEVRAPVLAGSCW